MTLLFYYIIFCPEVLCSPKVVDIIYFVVKLSGGPGVLCRWRESAKEGDKIESLDGHWEALTLCVMPGVKTVDCSFLDIGLEAQIGGRDFRVCSSSIQLVSVNLP